MSAHMMKTTRGDIELELVNENEAPNSTAENFLTLVEKGFSQAA